MNYTLFDPTGNITLLVHDPVPVEEQPAVAAALMQKEPRAEQVGFLQGHTLRMAGGEFCGNASMSAAAWLCAQSGETECALRVSGAEKPVRVRVEKTAGGWRGTVEMPPPLEILPPSETIPFPAVRFAGIAHVIADRPLAHAERRIKSWCAALHADACGVMQVEGDALTPLVYVPAADTLVWEGSCASGTAAAGVWLAERAGGPVEASFRQPAGVLTVAAAPGRAPRITGTVKMIL